MRVVGRRKTASRHQQVPGVPREKRTVRDPDTFPLGQVLPLGIRAKMVILHRRTAQTDLIVKLPCLQNILPSQAIFSVYPTGFPYANLHTESNQIGLLVA